MKVDMKDKVVIVTGAAGGIGRECAKVLLENGAQVIIADIAKEKGQDSAEELSAKGVCRFIHTDVTSRDGVSKLIETVLAEFGKIDVLVKNLKI